MGLIGESGSGKSTIGRMIVGLDRPSSGQLQVLGRDMAAGVEDPRELKRRVQMIFQDSSSSLNPRMSLAELLTEPLRVNGLLRGRSMLDEAHHIGDQVQLAQSWMSRRPAEFSGGQRQRISIGRALALDPEVVVADEPVSALDVSVQARILNLLKDIQAERGLSLVFISHDMAVVEFMSDTMLIMKSGRAVEYGDAADILHSPQHEYTKQLISASPSI